VNNFLEANDIPLSASQDAVHAIILNNKNEYLFQLRDNKKEIFYPLHWGVFGGGLKNFEDERIGLQREIFEELSINLKINEIEYFTNFTFDLSFKNLSKVKVSYFTVFFKDVNIDNIKLSEGIEFKFLPAKKFLTKKFIVPLDAFAVWLHYSKNRIFF
jgi:8-oxo-dGTP pyrophosphatase MutT (NUDIX family)